MDKKTSIPFTAADFPIDDAGRIYHLQLKPEDIAPDIILVGDPGRAKYIGSMFLSDLTFEHEHRGLVTVTGTSEITGKQATILSPSKLTVTTSGMGAPSLEIIVNELVALNEIDLKTRTRKPEFPQLRIIRVGTSGGLQPATKLGTPIITSYAVGMDNSGQFYDIPYADATCERLEEEIGFLVQSAMPSKSRFYGKIKPYVGRAEPILVDAMLEAAADLGVECKRGLTVSASGFFAAQGRDVARVHPSVPDIDRILAGYDPGLHGQRIENMEMEAAFLLNFLGGLGYWSAAICPAIANRYENTFDANYQKAIENATRIALTALAITRRRYPDERVG